MRQNTCAIIGCSPIHFPWGYDEEDESCAALKLLLLNRITLLRAEEVTDFTVVMDSGVGLYAAEMINSLRENDPEMSLTCLVPYEEQPTKWTPELRDRYFNEQAKCSDVEFASMEKTAASEAITMLIAVDKAEHVIAVKSETDYLIPVALHYAERLERKIIAVDAERMQYYA